VLAMPGYPAAGGAPTPSSIRTSFASTNAAWESCAVAPVARVELGLGRPYAAAACEVLETNRRIARGRRGDARRLSRGSSIVQHRRTPAALGALNRALAARGVLCTTALRIEPAATDSGPLVGVLRVLRRYQLQTGQSGRTGVLATVAARPGWCEAATCAGGSRLDR